MGVIVQVCIVFVAALVVGFMSYCKRSPPRSIEDYFLIAPDLWKLQIEIAAKRFDAKLVMNSTRMRDISARMNALDDSKKQRYFSLRQRYVNVIFINTNTLLSGETSEQLSWLQHVLASSATNWVVIAGHHDLEENRSQPLQRMLLPLFLQHGVHVYVHDGKNFSCRNDHGISIISIGALQQSRNNQADFILTRVTALEMEFIFMNSNSEAVSRAFATNTRRATM